MSAEGVDQNPGSWWSAHVQQIVLGLGKELPSAAVGVDLMKTFACGDVVPGCTASWEASTDDEILVLVAAHAGAEHGMTITPELASSVVGRIVTVS